ncbi:MAG: DsbA family protein [Actinomycetota bacterium]|nr:DsbA family protein [Actinomycetota bacterium]
MSPATPVTVESPASVDFHFDVMCPFAFQTSKWMRAVRDELGLTVNWRFFSLEEVNRVEGKKHPWEREWSYGWSMMRIGALLRRTDMALLDAWYATAGSALHEYGLKPHDPAIARQLVEGMGLDPALVDAAIADPTTHDEVHTEHQRVIDSGGFGVPTLIFPDGQALFGPVLIDPPTGAAAVRLWRGVTAWLEFPHLYELQRPKTAADQQAIVQSFQPYLDGRDWVSINRGEVISFGGGARLPEGA